MITIHINILIVLFVIYSIIFLLFIVNFYAMYFLFFIVIFMQCILYFSFSLLFRKNNFFKLINIDKKYS